MAEFHTFAVLGALMWTWFWVLHEIAALRSEVSECQRVGRAQDCLGEHLAVRIRSLERRTRFTDIEALRQSHERLRARMQALGVDDRRALDRLARMARRAAGERGPDNPEREGDGS